MKKIKKRNPNISTKSNINSYSVRKDIEKSDNIGNAQKIHAYYSDRYGWTLRKNIT